MRFDFISIFPDFFHTLDFSLMGKAQDGGLLDVHSHDLRAWTTDLHRTVDGTPYGGGPGMVMRPDVWGEAIDQVLAAPVPGVEEPRRVLAIPTPSGVPLTQAIANDLVSADQIIVACGRYEGIDQRVSDYYRSEEWEVLEYSIGDYVLNGGEVAALVLVEAVARLLEGVIGNPDSLVQESFNGSLVEYPVYTRPRSWRDLHVPAVLTSGNHAEISRWQRDRALVRTATRRPDLLESTDPTHLSLRDREVLAGAGLVLKPRGARIRIRLARAEDLMAVVSLAAETFPLACPPQLDAHDIQAFIADHLSFPVFSRFMDQPDLYRILVVEHKATQQLLGYSLTILGGPDGMPTSMVRPGKVELGAAYLSKFYMAEEWHGSGIAGALMERCITDVEQQGRNSQVVLGTNISNKRAKKFYKRHQFHVIGRRTFQVGDTSNIDDVLVRNITPQRPSRIGSTVSIR